VCAFVAKEIGEEDVETAVDVDVEVEFDAERETGEGCVESASVDGVEQEDMDDEDECGLDGSG